MLNLFRINDPYRLVFLYLILLLMRLPYWLGGTISLEEINWLLIGEKLANGGLMYVDVWENIGPLSAYVYYLLHFVFGNSLLPLQIMAFLLICYQSALFNSIMFRNKAYNENTYVPAFIYGVLMMVFFDMATLSPALMSTTFVLLALNNVYLRIEQKLDDNIILKTGIYLGIAALLHMPSIAFLLFSLLSLVFFTGTILRRYMLLLFGFSLPIILVAVYYFTNDGLLYFYRFYILSSFIFDGKEYLDFYSLLAIFSFPFLLFFIAILKTISMPRFTNYQRRVQQVMLLLFLAALLSWFLTNKKAPFQLVVFVAPFAFFIAHWLLNIRKRIWASVFSLLIFAGIIVLNHGSYFNFSPTASYIRVENLIKKNSPYDQMVEGKSIWILGDHDALYHKAQSATPYIAWELSRKHLNELDFYDNLAIIHNNVSATPPEVIIDLNGYMPTLKEHIYFLEANYEKISQQLYLKRSN